MNGSGVLASLERLALDDAAAHGLGLAAGELRLRKAWPRGHTALLLEYGDENGVSVAGQWLGDVEPGKLRRLARDTASRGPALALPERGVVLQAQGADRRLAPLASLAGRPSARLLSHRPERRGVVRVAENGGAHYVKVVRSGRTAALVRGARTVAAGGIGTPRLVAADLAAGTTVWEELRGPTLHALLGAEATVAAERVGYSLRKLHDSRAPHDLPVHDRDAERRVLERWVAATAYFLPARAIVARSALAAVAAALDRPSTPLVPVHRDLHERQIVVGVDGAVSLLDTDTVSIGERALDLANLLVHLELRALQGHTTAAAAHETASSILDGYSPGREASERLCAYAAATRLRLACVYAFRPTGHDCADRLLERLQAPLTGLDRPAD